MMKGKPQILWFLVLVLPLLGGCRKDNGLSDNLAASALISDFAKEIKYNYGPKNRLKGVFKLSLMANQAFDANHWGWEEPSFFLEGGNRVISGIQTFANPLPITTLSFRFFGPYGDGTLPYNEAFTGALRPADILSMKRTNYSASGVEVPPVKPDTYQAVYNAQTGLLESYIETAYDTAGALSTVKSYNFASDPRSSAEFFIENYILRSGVNSTITGITNTKIILSVSATLDSEQVEERNYDAAGALADFTNNSFGTANGATVVKRVTTKAKYLAASGDIAKNTLVQTLSLYSDETSLVWQQVETTLYTDYHFSKKSSYTVKKYNMTGSTKTLIEQNVQIYANGFVAEIDNYTVASGKASLASVELFTRDAQGQITLYQVKNTSGQVTAKTTYTRDTQGRLTQLRAVSVDPNTGNETCTGANYDKTYETLTSSSGTYKKITQTTFPCSGATVSSSPSAATATTYNAFMQPLVVQTYTFVGPAAELTGQTEYTYNSKGAVTKKQDYTVSAGQAVKAGYTLYQYDSNDFLISSIPYDLNDQGTAAYVVTSYTYR